MPVSPARKTAYQILRQVESSRAFAVDLLQGSRVSRMREEDRRLAMELIMGVLRWRGELDFQIEPLSGRPLRYFDPEVATILRLGIYQIRFLAQIPKRAVVNDAVELTKAARKRSAAGFVNAVLRKCAPGACRPDTGSAAEPRPEFLEGALRSLPSWLRERWARHFGPDSMKRLAWVSNAVPCTTLRVTLGGASRERIQRELGEEGIQTWPGRYEAQALVVESGNVHFSAALREGRVIIQDEASQLVGTLLAPKPGQRVLDLCAAPGIKTRQVAAALGRGLLVASDLSSRRLRTMTRLLREGIPPGVQLHLVRLDATCRLPFGCRFDRILLDVPCSGTGTLARNPEIKLRLQPKDLPRLARAQVQMLRSALEVLAPGGRLVYGTCSLEPEENEQVVEKILGESQRYRLLTGGELCREFPALAPLLDSRGYFRTRPDLHWTDGFFAAVLVPVT